MKRTLSVLFGLLVLGVVVHFSAKLLDPASSLSKRWRPYEKTGPLPSVYLEELTWTEVQSGLDQGIGTILIPTGGTEQGGPHLVLGKHNKIVKETSGRIARSLGDALVAPVMAYVPEGNPEQMEGHTRFPGTVSIPEEVFQQVLEHAARSLVLRGFREIYFIGDSGGNQHAQDLAAKTLQAEFSGKGIIVSQISSYYDEANGQVQRLMAEGESEKSIGRHAGIRDTSELMAVDAAAVRQDRLAPDGGGPSFLTGVAGDPTRATPERGEQLLTLKVEAAVAQIRSCRRSLSPGG